MNFKLLLLVFIFNFSVGQNFESITNYSKYSELNSDIIYNVEEDKKGNFWLATDNGIVKFNGNSFKKYTIKEGLPSNDIFKIKIDSKNRIWFSGYYSGLYYIKNDKVLKVVDSDNYNAVEYFYKTKDTVFFKDEYFNYVVYLTNDNKLKKVDKSNIIKLKSFNNHKIEVFRDNISKAFFIKDRGKLVAVPKNYVFYPNLSTVYPIFIKDIKITQYHPLNRNIIGDLIYYKNKKWLKIKNQSSNFKILSTDYEDKYLIIESDKKIFVYDNQVYNLSLSNKLTFINTLIKKIFYIKIDSKNNVWIVTNDNQLIFVPNDYKQIISYKSEQIFNDSYTSIKYGAILKNDFFFISSDNKLFRYNLIEKNKVLIDTYHDESTYKIIFRKTDFIVCTNKNIYFYNNVKYKLYNRVTLTPNKGVKIFENEIYYLKGSSINSINAKVLEFKDEIRFKDFVKLNNQFFFTNENFLMSSLIGVQGYSKISLKFINLLVVYKDMLIAGTNNSGLYLINKNLDIVFKTELEENVIDLKVDKNFLYVLSTKSFRVYEITSKSFKLINIKTSFDGFLNPKYSNIDFDKNNIYIFGQNGTTIIRKRNINYIPDANVEIECEQFSRKKDIVLERENNNLTFRFNINTFENPSIFKRYIKLTKGNENSKWELIKNRSLIYKDLKPGEYVLSFKIESENSNFKSKIDTLKFKIKPYFWETSYFVIIILLFIVLLVYLVLVIYKYKIRNRALIIQKMNDLELKALKSQMNPHFIFNTLNILQSVIITKDERTINNFFSKFSKMLRTTLHILNADKVTVLDEINYLRSYIELEQLRSLNHFDYFVDLEENLNLNDYEIPVMLLQPIVENSIEHGINNINERGLIKITMKKHVKGLVVSIEDNGIGLNNSTSKNNKKDKSYAINIIKDRIKIFNIVSKVKYEIEYVDLNTENKRGTRFTLVIKNS